MTPLSISTSIAAAQKATDIRRVLIESVTFVRVVSNGN
jgi:hypothetical protein